MRKTFALLCQHLNRIHLSMACIVLSGVVTAAQANIVNTIKSWWDHETPEVFHIGIKTYISRQYSGFSSSEKIISDKGYAHVLRIQYGQVHLKTANDPLFLMVGGRDVLIRIVVKGDKPGLRAPSVRLVLDQVERGQRLFNIILNAQGALPVSKEPLHADFHKTPFVSAYIAIIPGKDLIPGRYRIWVGGGTPDTVYIKPYQEYFNVQPAYTLPVTVMPFQWKDGIAPNMTQHTPELYKAAFERYFPFIHPHIRIRPFAVISSMNESNFNENQLHLDGTTMMIADQARKGLYIGVYHKSKHNWIKGERVGTSSGSLLVIQDQLGKQELDVLAHEIGHSLGLKHSPCGNPEPPIDTQFPYPNAGIGQDWGLDWYTDPQKIKLVDPDQAKDLMSYCFEHRFISDYNYMHAHQYWIKYRKDNYLALNGDIYALQLLAYPPAHQMEVQGIADLVEGFDPTTTQKSAYTFEIFDQLTGEQQRIPAFIKTLPDGKQAFMARFSAIGWLNISHIALLDPSNQVIMDENPTLNQLNQDTQADVQWTRQGSWLGLSFNSQAYDRGIVVYRATNSIIATLAFLNASGQQHVSLKGLPSGGTFWVILGSTQQDIYGRRLITTIQMPWSKINAMASR